MRKKKVVVLYRVIQEWRAPIFEKLNETPNIELEVWHGPDFIGSKVVSSKKLMNFKRKKLVSVKLKLNSTNGKILMPFSPFLLFSLIFHKPDIIICEGASNIANSFQAFIYSKLFGKKFIWWSLGKLLNRTYDFKRTAVDRIIQYIERTSDAIITYSTRGYEYFASLGINSKKIFVAVNVVDTDNVCKTIIRSPDIYELRSHFHKQFEFVVLFVGALIKEKKVDMLLKAQHIIEKVTNKVCLIMVGDGESSNELNEFSREIGIQNVYFVGARVDDNYKYFAAGDLFVLPGLGGLAISEAMCYGLPIIASIGDGSETDLVTEYNGVVDKNLNEYKLAEYILEFYYSPSKTKLFGEESKKIIDSGLNVRNYLDQITHAIES